MELSIYYKNGRVIYLEDVKKIEHIKTVANEGAVDYLWIENKNFFKGEISQIKIKF